MGEKKHYCIITAGGIGTRMGGTTPKQFLKLNGKPILYYTLKTVFELKPDGVWITLPFEYLNEGEKLIRSFFPVNDLNFIKGGSTRFDSIHNALKEIEAEKDDLVAVHDGVRPLASFDLFQLCFQEAEKYGSAVAAIKAKDTIRVLNSENPELIDRNKVFLTQTPQAFNLRDLKNAYLNAIHNSYTDDGAVFQEFFGKLHLVDGEEKNFKITTPEDLKKASTYFG